jgi:hypothetical protein
MCVARLLSLWMMIIAPVFAAGQLNRTRQSIENSPKSLAAFITTGSRSEKEKVEAIFRWVADNIEYKVKGAFNRNVRMVEEDNDTTALKPLSERVAEQVLRDRVAFCDGYARLFTTLCSYSGIRSEVITGYARTGFERSNNKFYSNHTWNAVYFDSSWHLLDVTWASGFISYGNDKFIKSFDNAYFLTPPQQFIRNHYPEDLQWTLLQDPPTLKEFGTGPFKPSGFMRNHITAFQPAQGIIEAQPGDTLWFELQPGDVNQSMRVVDTNEVDSLLLSQVNWWLYPAEPTFVEGAKVKMRYIVPATGVKWLHIIYNNSVVLRYRLQLRDPLLADVKPAE